MTVLEAIKLSTDFFEKKGIESPRLNAELLLAHILNCKKLDLYLSFDKPLKPEELDRYREFLKRRARHEPLQYIVGDVNFYGLTFKVNPGALIPRPETEILVETIIENSDKSKAFSILDIGTGTGIIPVTLSVNLPLADISAMDVSPAALELAKINAGLNEVSSKISFIEADIMTDQCKNGKKYDVIVSNPPYIELTEYETLQPEIVQYEPRLALTDEKDGLMFYRRITSLAKDMLNPEGRLFFEIGKGQRAQVSEFMSENGFDNIKVIKDYQNIERIIFGELR